MIWYIDMMHFSWVLACWTRQIVEYQHALMVQHQAMRKPENEWYGVIQNVLIKSWHFPFGMETGRVWKSLEDVHRFGTDVRWFERRGLDGLDGLDSIVLRWFESFECFTLLHYKAMLQQIQDKPREVHEVHDGFWTVLQVVLWQHT